MNSLDRPARAQSHQVYKVGRFVRSAAGTWLNGEVQLFQPEKGVRVIDMRSDVLTKPTSAMRDAMANATADDEVYREDRKVLELESQMAKMFGKEAALFVPSCTMANLIGVMSHCQSRGLEVLLGDNSHMFMWEQGGISQLKAKADKHNIPIHVDGARILNAAVALNITPKDLMDYADSVSFCFSKGVGAPIGSVWVGSLELIARALRLRKVLGGGWRKPGGLAAAALVAMEDASQRLLQDHKNAKAFAKEINAHAGGVVHIDLEGVHTNMIMVEILRKDLSGADFCKRLSQVTENEYIERGEAVAVDACKVATNIIRFATHSSLTAEDVNMAARKTCYVLNELSKVFQIQRGFLSTSV